MPWDNLGSDELKSMQMWANGKRSVGEGMSGSLARGAISITSNLAPGTFNMDELSTSDMQDVYRPYEIHQQIGM